MMNTYNDVKETFKQLAHQIVDFAQQSTSTEAKTLDDCTKAIVNATQLTETFEKLYLQVGALVIRLADAERLRDEAVAACRTMMEWDDSEKAGPDYGGLTRDTHPDGEAIWRRWWEDQHLLCSTAFDRARDVVRTVASATTAMEMTND